MIGSRAFRVASKEIRIDLVSVSVTGLGFKEAELTTTRLIYQRAQDIGLTLCPSEVGPQLCWQYKDQSKKKAGWRYIAMKPIILDDSPLIFGVGHTYGKHYLHHFDGPPDLLWDNYNTFVFQSCDESPERAVHQ